MIAALLLLLAQGLPSQGRLEAAVRQAIAGSCPGRKVSIDHDLSRACRDFVAAARAGKAPVTGSAISFYASLDSSEPAPVAGVARVRPPAEAERTVGELFPKACLFNRVGVAAGLLPAAEAVVCALTAWHGTDLAHIPGQVEEFDTVRVAGRLAPGLSNPRLYVTRPTGEVEEIGLAASEDEFATRVQLRETGEHSLEVLADGPGGPQVVAQRRVFAGIRPPQSPPAEPRQRGGLAGVEASIARLRAARGLPPLRRDAELDAVAEAHSREMARLRTFAHVLPTDGALGDRLRARGYAYKSAGENIGLSEDVATAHDAIVGSPAHLANLIDPRHRRLGLGAARGPTPEGAEGVYLTEVLAAPIVGSPDPAGDVARLLDGVRRKHGLQPLQRDAELDSVAQHEVSAAALADQMAMGSQAATAALRSVRGLHSAVAEMYVGSGPDVTAVSRNLAEPQWTRLGVGAIYASSKQLGPGRLWVLLLYGR